MEYQFQSMHSIIALMVDRHRLGLAGHRLTLTADQDSPDHLELAVDGRHVADVPARPPVVTVRLDQVDTGLDLTSLGLARARVRALTPRRGQILSAALVLPPDPAVRALGRSPSQVLEFEPPAGSCRHGWWRFQRRHPRLWASRHVLVAVLQVGLALLALRLTLHWAPWQLLPWPDWRLPRLPWPDLPLPDLPDLPDWNLPEPPTWVRTVLASKKYWLPIVMALLVAAAEARRRQRSTGVAGPDENDRDGEPGRPG